MALADNKERIYVTVSSDMASRIDFYREKMGLSRSAFCAYLVGNGVMTMDKAMGLLDDMGRVIITQASDAIASAVNDTDQLSIESVVQVVK